ncbi:MAG: alanine racemase [Alphaproteobacteria bacterium]|nr:alanine racemase [Alphaproteobacteria bacterium]
MQPHTASGTALPATCGVLTIDLDAIAANWRRLAKTAVAAECAAIIKADAYGCGLAPVAVALWHAGCRTFFVADLREAAIARAALPHAALYALDGYLPDSGPYYASLNCKPVIGDINELAEWDAFCSRARWIGGTAIHIDTGMNRLGLPRADAQALIPRIRIGYHGVTLLISHLASSEQAANPANARQLALFRDFSREFLNVPASLANSSGIFLGPSFHFDIVRPGAALYGVNPTPDRANPMQPVVNLKARIIQTRVIERGESVGYGGTWTAHRTTRLAIVAAGYADGYFRSASSGDGTRGADVIVAGQRCPVAGRISMDLMTVDITDVPQQAARRGDLVTLLGDGITVDELAHHFGTNGYEVLTSLGHRYSRVYKGDLAAAAAT